MLNIDVSKLRPVDLSDRAFLLKFLAIRDSRSCECAMANLYLWQETYDERMMEFAGRLLVVEFGHRIMHFPIGEFLPPEELAALADALKNAGVIDGGIYDVPEEYLQCHPEAAELFRISEDEGAFDYLYRNDRLVEMAGPLLRKKRNLIRQFEKRYPEAWIEPLTAANLPLAVELAKALNRRLHACDFLEEEEESLAALQRYFAPLEMGGVLLYTAPGQPAGFSIYSRLNSDTADIHYEKADHLVKGAPQYLTWALARQLAEQNYTYMNREQDMNEPGLRQAKRSLDPCALLKRMFLTR